jgi:hypothetical protein
MHCWCIHVVGHDSLTWIEIVITATATTTAKFTLQSGGLWDGAEGWIFITNQHFTHHCNRRQTSLTVSCSEHHPTGNHLALKGGSGSIAFAKQAIELVCLLRAIHPG